MTGLDQRLPYLILLGAVVLAVLVHAVALAVLRDRRKLDSARNAVLARFGNAARVVLILIAIALTEPALKLSAGAQATVTELMRLAVIATVGWLLRAGLGLLSDLARDRYTHAGPNDLLARKLQTRIDVVGKVLVVFIVILTGAAMLMTIPGVRTLGTSILASAGLVGIVAGLAAQPLLTNLFAGIQLAITQPLRLNDVVVMSAPTSPSSPYWGTVEEITAAYVVIRVWDLRRLIVPLNYILQNPFENWTYNSSDLLGYVIIYADYRVNVDVIRDQAKNILEGSSWWDRQVWNVQVTTLTPETIGVRVLFSCANANDRWSLIVHMQEEMIRFLAAEYPEHLPRMRVEVPDSGPQNEGKTFGGRQFE